MARLALVILAGGMGSRFGGAKQLTAVGPVGEAIFDYSARDALRAGFDQVVIVTRSELEAAVTDHVRGRWPHDVDVRIVCQDRDPLAVAAGRAGRTKPLGTAHATLVGMRAADSATVGVVNADDLYGPDPYRVLAAALLARGGPVGALVTFPVGLTVIGEAPVTRALCEVADGQLRSIEEGTVVGARWTGTSGREAHLAGNEPVSMNFWGLGRDLEPALEEATARVVQSTSDAEALLPDLVRSRLGAGERVAALAHDGPCIGLTHPGDVEAVRRRLTGPAW